MVGSLVFIRVHNLIQPEYFRSIDMDDFSGRCGSGKFPLLSALNTELEGYKVDLEYDGPYESYNPRGKYTTKDRKCLRRIVKRQN